MRVKCQIKEIDRSYGEVVGGCQHVNLFVARRSGKVFLVCFIYRWWYVKYEVKDNVESIFKHHISEGKATIHLKNPFVSICISNAEVSKLRRLLFAIKLASKGDSLLSQSILSDIKIKSKENYPPAGFPLSLKRVQISMSGLQQIDSRILKLKYLVELNLSDNSIKNVPACLWSLKSLSKLNFCRNKIEYLPDIPSSHASSLTSLKLGYNKIQVLPNSICNLNRLQILELEYNSLTFLPTHIGRLANLKRLDVGENHLWFLPASAWKIRLVNVSGNDFLSFRDKLVMLDGAKMKSIRDIRSGTPTLQELAGRVIKKFTINFDGHVPNHLSRYLDLFYRCCCQTYCFANYIVYVSFTDSSMFWRLPFSPFSCGAFFQVGACSQRCLIKWKKDDCIKMQMNYD